MASAKSKYVLGLSVLLVAALGFNACNQQSSSDKKEIKLTGNAIIDGKALAEKHCSGCHQLVPVNALTKDVWTYHTLPSMAKYLGISTYGSDYFKRDSAANVGISLQEWSDIVAYYKSTAPMALDSQKRPTPLLNDWAGFQLQMPALLPEGASAFTSMVKVDTASHSIYTSDFGIEKLIKWGKYLRIQKEYSLPSGAADMSINKDAAGNYSAAISCVGQLEPMDFPNGRVLKLDLKSPNAQLTDIETDLSRPVYTATGDFNKDGLTDYVICAQGNMSGHIFWMKQNADHSYSRMEVKKQAGAIQVTVGDYNNDGWQDIIALFGSGDEGISLFLNDHKGGFKEQSLLRFPPVYGSSSFQLVDVNHDGKPDIIYTAGYNYRNSRILKPYHGLYIFLNQGNWKFKQAYFYPINGCTKAIAADFDGDGDIDIATSAFFADLQNNPAESFVYFEQYSNMYFKPHAVPVSKYGRWFSMDVNDINGDGKPDIVLGNYSKGLTIETNKNLNDNARIPFIVLLNQTKK